MTASPTPTAPGALPGRPVRVRFAPAPSGDLHVGNVRTALYNWAFARRHGGAFVFRVEDTDRNRATDEAYAGALDVLRWLGLDWDEGPETGGPHVPYRQSERLDVYARVLGQLRERGAVYPAYDTKEELEARAEQARREKRAPGYDGAHRDLTPDQVAAYEAEGRTPVWRLRMPEGETRFSDLIRGEVVFDNALIPDPALTRADGHPLYLLAATVDDVLMGITHIVRGEDLLPSVPRQRVLYAAMGLAEEQMPVFAHLPLITGEDGKPLSKRNGEVSIAHYRREGYLPEAMANYLALLGWSLDAEREVFTLAEMVEAFDVTRVSKNPARFDVKKLDAINGEHIRLLDPADFEARLLEALQQGYVLPDPVSAEQQRLVTALAPLLQTRLRRLAQASDMVAFLFVDEAHLAVDPGAAAKSLAASAEPVLAASLAALEGLGEERWGDPQAVEAVLREALVEGLGLKPRHAFGPLYVAVTGRPVAPPLFDSMALLGRETTLARVRAGLERARAAAAGAGAG
ncbi:MAG: glutamate--tRNA ligase [Actinomycetota bacterium]|nr:glutamate--tRNA ligase [Actinomycetota bacterium]